MQDHQLAHGACNYLTGIRKCPAREGILSTARGATDFARTTMERGHGEPEAEHARAAVQIGSIAVGYDKNHLGWSRPL